MNADRKSIGSAPEREHRARTLAALGDPTRLGIVELLMVQDLSPDALAIALEVPGNLLAHHLKVLTNAEVVQRVHSQADRRRTYVQLVPGALDGLLPRHDPIDAARVVFVCTHNSARSVLAEALWREVSDVPSTSAGTHPADEINPRAWRIAEKLGLTIAQDRPQALRDVLRDDDVVISVCDSVNEELAPMANAHVHWSVPDPAAVGTDAAFATAADELRERVTHLAPRVHRRRATRKARP